MTKSLKLTIKDELEFLVSRGHHPNAIWAVPSGNILGTEVFAVTEDDIEDFARRWEVANDAFRGEGRSQVMRHLEPSGWYL